MKHGLRAVALLAVHNEARFITQCLEHLSAQGIEFYVIDNESTDGTPDLVQSFAGRGLVGMERFPRPGYYPWRRLLERKEELGQALDADWFLHVDADEFPVNPSGGRLMSLIAEADACGATAIGGLEFVFLPIRESPDHDHPSFLETMKWYHPFETPGASRAMKIWKRQEQRVELAWSGGHLLRNGGDSKAHTGGFWYRHYLFLSLEHAIQKYVGRRFDPEEVASGWHGWRVNATPDTFRLPSASQMRAYADDAHLDPSSPWAFLPFDRVGPYTEGLKDEVARLQLELDRVAGERDREIERLQRVLYAELSNRDTEISRLQEALPVETSRRDQEILRLQAVLHGAVSERDNEIRRLQALLEDAVAVRDAEIRRLQTALAESVAVRDAEIVRLQAVIQDAITVRDAEIVRLQAVLGVRPPA